MTDRRPGEEELRPLPEDDDLATEPASQRMSGPTKPAVVPEAKARAVAADGDHPYVDDRVSKVWVALILLVFTGILLYGLLFGRAGMLSSPSPSPSPTPSQSPTPSVTTSPSPAVSPSPSASPSASPTGPTEPPRPVPTVTRAPSPTNAFTPSPGAT